jgi:site-specific recombinase XerC
MFYKVRGISKKTGLGIVYVVFRDAAGKETLRSTGVQVNPKFFNTKTGKISPKDTLFPEKNAKIAATVTDFETVLRNLETAGLPLSAQLVGERIEEQQIVDEAGTQWHSATQDWRLHSIQKLETAIQGHRAKLVEMENELERRKLAEGLITVDKPVFFQDKLEEYFQVLKEKNLKQSTLKNYRVSANAVKRYRSELQMKDINLAFLNNFQRHLIERQMKNNSIREVFIKFLAVYKYYADELNLPTGFLSKFELVPARQDEEKIILNDEEIAQIEALVITTKGQHRTRECFLFCMECGIRYVDIPQVSRDTVVEVEGSWFLKLTNHKTSKQIEVPLTRKAIQILERNSFTLDRPQESQYNQALKAMAKKCPLFQATIIKTGFSGNKVLHKKMAKWEALTSHLARKKFTDNALDKDVSLMALAEYLGHANTQTLEKHYANKKRHARKQAHKLTD